MIICAKFEDPPKNYGSPLSRFYRTKANSKCKSKKIYRPKICNLGQGKCLYSTLLFIKMALCVGYRLKKALNKIIFWILIIKFNFYQLNLLLNFGLFHWKSPCPKLKIIERYILINFFYMEYFVNVIINSVLEIEEEEYIWM